MEGEESTAGPSQRVPLNRPSSPLDDSDGVAEALEPKKPTGLPTGDASPLTSTSSGDSAGTTRDNLPREQSFEEKSRALQRRIEQAQEEERLLELEERAMLAEMRVAEACVRLSHEKPPSPARSTHITTSAPVIRLRSNTADATGHPVPKRTRRAKSASSSDSEDDSRLRVVDPDQYEGKSYWDLQRFLRQCQNVFTIRSRQYRRDIRRVHYARSYLKGQPEKDWWTYEEALERRAEAPTWALFKQFLEEKVSPISIRVTEAIRKYREARQKPGQTIAAFASYMDELEQQMPPMGKEARIHNLLDGLRPEINSTILESASVPRSRDNLIVLATKIQEAKRVSAASASRERGYRGRGKGKESTGRDLPRPDREDHQNPPAGFSRGKPRSKFDGECHNCGRKGHKAAYCWSAPKRSESEQTPKDQTQ